MREIADEALAAEIAQIHERSRGTYGAPRVHAELAERGIGVSRRRVARLLRALGLEGVSRRRKRRTTIPDPAAAPAPDLVERRFSAEGPDRLWFADITYVPTWEGFLCLSVVMDAFSRRIIGWSMRDSLEAELVVDALGTRSYRYSCLQVSLRERGAMSIPHPLPEPLIELIAARFRALGEPTRIRIVDRLREGPATGQELAEALGGSQQNVSRHLGLLHQAGVLTRRKEGVYVRYAIADAAVLELCELVCGGIERQLGELSDALGAVGR